MTFPYDEYPQGELNVNPSDVRLFTAESDFHRRFCNEYSSRCKLRKWKGNSSNAFYRFYVHFGYSNRVVRFFEISAPMTAIRASLSRVSKRDRLDWPNEVSMCHLSAFSCE